MCSQKLSEQVGPESAGVMIGAIIDVAERSFFAAAEPCAGDRWQEGSTPASGWFIASLRFEEAGCAGVVSCMLPDALARALFDAFNGRDPLDPAPASGPLFDLVGEFANMICGAWLTRTVSEQAFVLTRPKVQRVDDLRTLAAVFGWRTTMAVNDLPLLVDVWMTPAREQAPMLAQA